MGELRGNERRGSRRSGRNEGEWAIQGQGKCEEIKGGVVKEMRVNERRRSEK